MNVLRTDRWKYMAKTGQLFDLRSDPREQTDVASTHSQLVERFQARLHQLVAEDRRLSQGLGSTSSAPSAQTGLTKEEILRR